MTSKLSSHGLGRGPSQSLIDAGAVGAKWVNASVPTTLPPGFIAIARWVRQGDVVSQWAGMTPEAAAQRYYDEQRHYFDPLPRGVYIEPQNEPNVTPQNAAWFWAYSLRFMQIVEAAGLKACIGNFAKGNPARPIANDNGTNGLAIWTPAIPVMRYAKAHGHLYGYHAYGNPKDVTDVDPWVMFRYREVYQWLPADARPGLVIGEWGLDTPIGQFRTESWRRTVGNADAAYLAMMKAYDAEVQRDSYVRFFTAYTEGTNSDPVWDSFNIEGQPIVQMMADYIRASGTTPPPIGEPPMAHFNIEQTVYVTPTGGVNILKDNGDKTDDTASWGNSGTVKAGPEKVKGEVSWKVQFPGKELGWVREEYLSGKAPKPTPTNTKRVMKLKVEDHATPRPIYVGPSEASGQRDDFHQGGGIGNRIDWTNSYFEMDAFEWSAADGDWFLHMKNGHSVFGGDAWVRYAQFGERLNVYDSGPGVVSGTLDGQGMPDWTRPPVVVTPPPDNPPPVVTPPDVPPVVIPENNLVVNGDFGGGWETGGEAGEGNQTPHGWTLEITPNGQPNLWPAHLQQGGLIPSIARIVPECVHKLPGQLPANEQVGQARALILPGAATVFKLFGKDAWSAQLWQVVTVEPNRQGVATVYVLTETNDKPTVPSGLEADHFRVSVFGQERTYATMKDRRDVPHNERAWNKFTVSLATGTDRASIIIEMQQMWPGVCDFFIGPVSVEYTDTPPVEPPDEPPAGQVDIEPELERIEAATAGFSANYTAYQAVVAEQIALIRQKVSGRG